MRVVGMFVVILAFGLLILSGSGDDRQPAKHALPQTATAPVTLTMAEEPSGSNRDVDDMKGKVTAVDATQKQFTLQTGGSTGRSATIKVDNKTVFEDFDKAGLRNAFSSVAVGQVLEVEAVLTADGILLAKEVELEN